MDEKKKMVRRKGRAETIISDLSVYGLSICGVTEEGDSETIVPIDSQNPYKDPSVFEKSTFYRVSNQAGETVIEHRRLSGVRRWIDSGEIENHQALADRRKFIEMYGDKFNIR